MMSKNSFLLAIVCGASLVLPACWPTKKAEVVPTQAKSSLYVINVLSEDLFNDAHIPGSISVPMDKVEAFAASTPHDAEVVVYCANYMCTASGAVAQQLMDKGFAHVYAYEAGIADWAQKGLPVEGPAVSPYLKAPSVAPHAGEKSSVVQIATQELYDKMIHAGLIKAPVIQEEEVVIEVAQPETTVPAIKE